MQVEGTGPWLAAYFQAEQHVAKDVGSLAFLPGAKHTQERA